MINEVFLLGHLGKDPEVRFTDGGQAVCKFSLATSEQWMKDGEKQERTEWHNIVVWGKMGEACGQYLAKGHRAFIKGSIRTRKWDKDGVTHWMTEIQAHAVKFLGPAQKGEARKPGAADNRDDSEIPF